MYVCVMEFLFFYKRVCTKQIILACSKNWQDRRLHWKCWWWHVFTPFWNIKNYIKIKPKIKTWNWLKRLKLGFPSSSSGISYPVGLIKDTWIFPILDLIQLIGWKRNWPHNLTTYHYTNEPTVSGRQRKAFNNLELCLIGSNLIQLIHLIKQIQYNIGKTRTRDKMNERLSHLGEELDGNPIYRCYSVNLR